MARTLLPELGLALLHGRDNHVTATSIGQPVQVRAEAERLNKEERLGATVVRAVDDGPNRETEGHAEFGTSGCSWLSKSMVVQQCSQDSVESERQSE